MANLKLLVLDGVACQRRAVALNSASRLHFDIAPVGLIEEDINSVALETYWDAYFNVKRTKLVLAQERVY